MGFSRPCRKVTEDSVTVVMKNKYSAVLDINVKCSRRVEIIDIVPERQRSRVIFTGP